MHVEAISKLMQMERAANPVIADLARTILTLVSSLRDAEHRAALAELALEAAQKTAVVA